MQMMQLTLMMWIHYQSHGWTTARPSHWKVALRSQSTHDVSCTKAQAGLYFEEAKAIDSTWLLLFEKLPLVFARLALSPSNRSPWCIPPLG